VSRDKILARKPNERSVTVVDVMILVAATACAFALLRAAGWEILIPEGFSGRLLFIYFSQLCLSAYFALLSCWTFAFILIRFRKPRPRVRRLFREPGIVACSAAAAALIVVAAVELALLLARNPWFQKEIIFTRISAHASFSALGGLVTLLLSGRWRAQKTWIDRLGRALGIGWIAGTAFDIYRTYWAF
jgi:hypothetical protein